MVKKQLGEAWSGSPKIKVTWRSMVTWTLLNTIHTWELTCFHWGQMKHFSLGTSMSITLRMARHQTKLPISCNQLCAASVVPILHQGLKLGFGRFQARNPCDLAGHYLAGHESTWIHVCSVDMFLCMVHFLGLARHPWLTSWIIRVMSNYKVLIRTWSGRVQAEPSAAHSCTRAPGSLHE